MIALFFLFQEIVEESSSFRRLVYRVEKLEPISVPGEMALSHSAFFPFLSERHFSRVEERNIFRDPDFDAGICFPFFFPPPLSGIRETG